MLVIGLAAAGQACQAGASTNIFEMPALWGQHLVFRQQVLQAVKQKDWQAMESACRGGIALLPADAVWRYNLACALALQGQRNEGLDALAKAIELGFQDADQMSRDDDLISLKTSPRYAELIQLVRDRKGSPAPGARVVRPASPDTNGVAWVSAQNTLWDLDLGAFKSFFTPSDRQLKPEELAAGYGGPLAGEMRAWLAAGTAAGNRDDFYDNRDDGHSRLNVRPFPGLARIDYDAQARQSRAHYGATRFLFNSVVIGNSSTALTGHWRWRSIPRALQVDGREVALQFAQYLGGQIYCYPEHRDYDADNEGDVFPANTPYAVITQGSSGSDQPVLNALAGTLAAFQPETKAYLKRQGLLMPTLQMILRASQRQVRQPQDYLTGAAHRPVLNPTNLVVETMLRMAHGLTSNDVPPMVALRTLRDDAAMPNRDFFDAAGGEGLFDTPCAIARVIRGMSYKHHITVGAATTALPAATNLTWHWVLLQGDPAKVEIKPLNPEGSTVAITVAYHDAFAVEPGSPLRSSRVDIGAFVHNGKYYSAPAFVTFFFLRNESRSYGEDGRILSVDYGAAANRYTDPMLSLARHWRDTYTYDPAGRLTGWTRQRGDLTETFTAAGLLVEQKDRLGRAITARTVRYLPRQMAGDNTHAPDLIQVNGDIRATYRYASDQDLTGEIASHVQVAD
jgi:YD repeat-containing protein